MIRGSGSRRGGLAGRADPGDNSALETDVVRFVAIVGLTFMVIFALVQSIPYEGGTTPEVEIVPQSPPAPAKPPAATSVPPEPLREPTSELVATRLELDRARAAVASLEAESADESARHRTEVARLRDRVELLEGRLRETTLAVDEVVVEEPAPEPDPEPSETAPGPAIEAEGPTSPEGIPERLILRFRDDRVYLDLLARGRIRSYVHIPALDLTYRVFRETPERLGFSLVYDRADGAVYEIPHAEVPAVLRDGTRRFDLKLSLRDDLDYLVVLSDTIRGQVERLEALGESGYYDILESERVVPAGRP